MILGGILEQSKERPDGYRFTVKGGVALELRLKNRARATKDIDLVLHHAEVDLARALAAWRNQPKWVVSRTLKSLGPNATLVDGDVEAVIRELTSQHVGEIDVAGPDLAGSLTDLGLIDEYRLSPSCLAAASRSSCARPPLRLAASDLIADDVIRLTYVPV